MKSCPTCDRTYPDDTLAFCLADGSILSAPYDPATTRSTRPARDTNPPPTEVFNPGASRRSLPPTEAAPKDIPSTIHSPFVPQPSYGQQPDRAARASEYYGSNDAPRKSSIVKKALIVLGVLAVLLVGGFVVLEILFATNRPTTQNTAPPRNVNATNSNSQEKVNSDIGAEYEAKVREKLRSDPDNEELNRNLAAYLLMQKKFDDAELYARKAVRLSPKTSPPHYSLALVLNHQGKTAEAQAEMKLADKLKAQGK
jgi:cytoskeletal protein RodZ